MTQLNIAVLDDYSGISESHFSKLDSSKYRVTQFTETLLPYHQPETPQSVKDELVQRLESFDVICMTSLQEWIR